MRAAVIFHPFDRGLDTCFLRQCFELSVSMYTGIGNTVIMTEWVVIKCHKVVLNELLITTKMQSTLITD